MTARTTGAVTARPAFVIAIDGPAASGKGTLARRIAERLGYAWLDTGLLYRAAGLAALALGEEPAEPASAEKAARLAAMQRRTPRRASRPCQRRAPRCSNCNAPSPGIQPIPAARPRAPCWTGAISAQSSAPTPR
jgi:hypothetical protein